MSEIFSGVSSVHREECQDGTVIEVLTSTISISLLGTVLAYRRHLLAVCSR